MQKAVRIDAWRHHGRLSRDAFTSNAISYPDEPGLRKPGPLHFFRIVKEQPIEAMAKRPGDRALGNRFTTV